MPEVTFNFEYDRRLRWAHVGCGDHSYRNVLPAFRYCPIDLLAVCDVRARHAADFARVFGAERYETDYDALLNDSRIEVISLVLGVDSNMHVAYPKLAIRALEAGKDVWIEKPPANSSREIRDMMAAEKASGKRVFCGLKKMFFPAIARAATIAALPEFGAPVQFTTRYPQPVPSPEDMKADSTALVWFRDHICHPMSIALRLVGPIRETMYIREAAHGGGIVLLQFENGAIGSIHLCPGMGNTGPMERTEVVGGAGGHLVIDNNVDLHWYRHGEPKPYGRCADFTSPPEQAALHWQPEFSLGVLYNSGLFLLGYAIELNHFCDAILNSRPFECAGTNDMLHLTAVYEAFLRRPAGTWARVGEL